MGVKLKGAKEKNQCLVSEGAVLQVIVHPICSDDAWKVQEAKSLVGKQAFRVVVQANYLLKLFEFRFRQISSDTRIWPPPIDPRQ